MRINVATLSALVSTVVISLDASGASDSFSKYPGVVTYSAGMLGTMEACDDLFPDQKSQAQAALQRVKADNADYFEFLNGLPQFKSMVADFKKAILKDPRYNGSKDGKCKELPSAISEWGDSVLKRLPR